MEVWYTFMQNQRGGFLAEREKSGRRQQKRQHSDQHICKRRKCARDGHRLIHYVYTHPEKSETRILITQYLK